MQEVTITLQAGAEPYILYEMHALILLSGARGFLLLCRYVVIQRTSLKKSFISPSVTSFIVSEETLIGPQCSL